MDIKRCNIDQIYCISILRKVFLVSWGLSSDVFPLRLRNSDAGFLRGRPLGLHFGRRPAGRRRGAVVGNRPENAARLCPALNAADFRAVRQQNARELRELRLELCQRRLRAQQRCVAMARTVPPAAAAESLFLAGLSPRTGLLWTSRDTDK